MCHWWFKPSVSCLGTWILSNQEWISHFWNFMRKVIFVVKFQWTSWKHFQRIVEAMKPINNKLRISLFICGGKNNCISFLLLDPALPVSQTLDNIWVPSHCLCSPAEWHDFGFQQFPHCLLKCSVMKQKDKNGDHNAAQTRNIWSSSSFDCCCF